MPSVIDTSSTPDLADVPERDWDVARRRLAVISGLAQARVCTRSAARIAAQEIGCSVALIYRLLLCYEADPRLTSLLPGRRGRRHGQRQLRAEVEDVIKGTIEEVYLTRQRARLSVLMREVEQRCRRLALPAPSRKAVQSRVNTRTAAEIIARREGRRAARDRFAPATGGLDAPAPLSVVQIDHTLVDVIVVDSVTRAPIQRPWLTLATDVCSRCVLGFYLSLESPSAVSVALCIAHAALPKDEWLAARAVKGTWPARGIPERLHLDNGREFHSEALLRGCEQHAIAVDYRPVRTPHYGGHIERLIGAMMGKVHLLPGTTFSNVQEKGDWDPDKTASLTLVELEQWLATAIVGVYHQEIHRGLGTTPLAAWERGVSHDAHESLPICDPRRFLIDFLPIERRRIRREGVFLHSIAYWSGVLATWIGEREKMIVRYDPRDLSRVYLLAPDGRYYDLAYRDLRRPPISFWEHRAALKRLREDARREVNEMAIFEAIEAMRRLTEHASTHTKSIRRRRERQRHWAHQNLEPQPLPATAAATPPVELIATDERIYACVEEWA